MELDKDELDESNQNLVEAGGNPRQQIQSMVQEHDSQTRAHPNPPAANAELRSRRVYREISRLAADQTERTGTGSGGIRRAQKAQALSARHSALASELDATKGRIPELALHTKAAKDGTLAPPPATLVQHSHADAASLVGRTKAIAADQAILSLVDRRIADQNQLARVYGQWTSVAALQAQRLAHGVLLDALIVIGVLILCCCWTAGCSTCWTGRNWIAGRSKPCAALRA